MQPLLEIENVPISIEYVESKIATHNMHSSAKMNISKRDNTSTIKTNPINLPLRDTYRHVPISNTLSYTATAKYTANGNIRMNVQMDEDTSEFVFRQFNRGIDNMIGHLPNSMINRSTMQIDFDITQLPSGLVKPNNLDTSFMPPDLEIKIVEHPKVIIKYVGGPIYIPKSADPNYVEPEQNNKVFDGQPNLDVKA